MFLVPFFDLQNFILLVRTVQFLRKIFFISSYTAKNNYFLLYELIQDLPYYNHKLQISPGPGSLVSVLFLLNVSKIDAKHLLSFVAIRLESEIDS